MNPQLSSDPSEHGQQKVYLNTCQAVDTVKRSGLCCLPLGHILRQFGSWTVRSLALGTEAVFGMQCSTCVVL